MNSFVEIYKNVVGTASTATSALTTGVADWVCLKNAHRAVIEIVVKNAGGGAAVWQPQMTTAVAGTGTNITDVVQIWANEDISATDTLARQTDATSYTQTGDTNNKHIVFDIDPATLIANVAGAAPTYYDCLGIYVSGGGDGSDIATVIYHLYYRYQEDNPPSAIID